MFAQDRNGNDFIKLIGRATYFLDPTISDNEMLDVNFDDISTPFIAIYSDNILHYSYVPRDKTFTEVRALLVQEKNDGFLDIGANLFPYVYVVNKDKLKGLVILNKTGSEVSVRIRGNLDVF